MRYHREFAILLFLGILTLRPALAIDCAQLPSTDTASKVATAAMWANMRKSDGSIAKESKALLESAIQKFQARPAAPAVCGADCPTTPAYIAFDVTPSKFLTDYSDRATCEGQLKTTRDTPLVYRDRHFAALDELNSWFGDFSSGKGKRWKRSLFSMPRRLQPAVPDSCDSHEPRHQGRRLRALRTCSRQIRQSVSVGNAVGVERYGV
jgi:hypothetical protein